MKSNIRSPSLDESEKLFQRMVVVTAQQKEIAQDDDTTRFGHLPPGKSLQGFYPSIISQFEHLAQLVIHHRFCPRIWLKIAQHRRQKLTALRCKRVVPSSLVSTLKVSELFRLWPESALQSLLQNTTCVSYQRDEIIFYEGEGCQQGIFLSVSGTLQLIKRDNSKGIHSGQTVGSVRAPHLFGEYGIMNEEIRLVSAVATTDCDFVVISRSEFVRVFQLLDAVTGGAVLQKALDLRRDNMGLSLPMSISRVRMCPIFRRWSSHYIKQLIARLQPRVVAKGNIIFHKGTLCSEICFLRRGCILVDPDGDHGRRSFLISGAALGHRSLLYKERLIETYTARSNCDLWVLSSSDLESVMLTDESLRAMVATAAAEQRAQNMQAQQTLIVEDLSGCIERIPLLRNVIPKKLCAALAAHFKARVYNARDVICSTAEYVDKIIILSRGRALIRDKRHPAHYWAIGEAVGYPCLVQHRWAFPVVAIDPVDAWVLDRGVFCDFLRSHHLYAALLHITQMLLQPIFHAGPTKFTDLLEASVLYRMPDPNTFSDQKTPNLHSISYQATHQVYAPWRDEVTKRGGFGNSAATNPLTHQAVSAKELPLLPLEHLNDNPLGSVHENDIVIDLFGNLKFLPEVEDLTSEFQSKISQAVRDALDSEKEEEFSVLISKPAVDKSAVKPVRRTSSSGINLTCILKDHEDKVAQVKRTYPASSHKILPVAATSSREDLPLPSNNADTLQRDLPSSRVNAKKRTPRLPSAERLRVLAESPAESLLSRLHATTGASWGRTLVPVTPRPTGRALSLTSDPIPPSVPRPSTAPMRRRMGQGVQRLRSTPMLARTAHCDLEARAVTVDQLLTVDEEKHAGVSGRTVVADEEWDL